MAGEFGLAFRDLAAGAGGATCTAPGTPGAGSRAGCGSLICGAGRRALAKMR